MKIKELKSHKFGKTFTVSVEFEDINSKVENDILEASKNFRMPGFREGKVPLSIIRQKVGKEKTRIRIQEKISSLVKHLVESKDIKLYSKPDIVILSYNQDSGLLVEIKFEVFPEIPVINWEDIKIERVNITVSNVESDNIKSKLFKEFTTFKKISEGYLTKLGDKVKISFDGKIEGKDFDGNKSDNMQLIIGDNNFLDEFEKQLIGCEIHEQKTFRMTFPNKYPKKELANKEAIFKVRIIDIEELEPITKISNEMLEKVGVKSHKKLNILIKQIANSDLVNSLRTKMKKDIFDAIDKKYTFEVPEKMIKQDFDVIWNEFIKNNEKSMELRSDLEKIKSKYRKISNRRVKLGLIMADITKKNSIAIGNEEINKIIDLQKQQNPQDEKKIVEFYKDSNNLERIQSLLLEEKALDFILSKIQYNDIEMTKKQFIKQVLPLVKEY